MTNGDYLVRWRLDDVLCDVQPNEHGKPWCLTLDLSRESTGESGAFEWNARYPDLLTIAPPDRVSGTGERPLLVTHNQGIGDFIQQFRYLRTPQLAGRRVLLECPARLRQFVEAQAMNIEIVEPRHLRDDGTMDEISNMRLDQWFADPTSSGSYLKAPSTGRGRSNKRLRAGINWSAMLGTLSVAEKSIPLRELEVLVAPRSDIEWVSLQWGPSEQDLDQYPWAAAIRRRGQVTETLAGLAKEIAELDLLITIDSAPAHIAGALGVPVWTLLGQAVAWRWRLGHSSSHLYGSMTLFRQDERHGWPGLVNRVGNALDGGDVLVNGAQSDGMAQYSESLAVRFADDPTGTAQSRGVRVEPDDYETLAGILQLLVRCYRSLPWSVAEPEPSSDLQSLGALKDHPLVSDVLAAVVSRRQG